LSFFIKTSSPEDWKSKLADPKHWKPGYSAMALAYSWMEAKGFPKSVKDVFQKSEYSLFQNIEFLIGIAEQEVPLPGGRRPSQNDIFVIAKNQKNLVSIVVEGKVNEPFGELVVEWSKDKSAGKAVRLKFLCDSLGLKEASIQGVRYQLLHRTVSALLEARRFNASTALLLVHSFSQKNLGFHDYSRFAKHLGLMNAQLNNVHFVKRIDNIDLYLAWVTGKEKYLCIKENK